MSDSFTNVFLTSYDVESLFTPIPVERTIEHICTIVPSSELPFDKSTLKDLLLLSCKNIVFSFNNTMYEQFDGMCMGLNLGPTMAAYAMHMVESKYLFKPLFYTRYVDDVFAAFNNMEEAEIFHQHICTIDPNIKFTCEDEKDGELVFLDTCIFKHLDKLETM